MREEQYRKTVVGKIQENGASEMHLRRPNLRLLRERGGHGLAPAGGERRSESRMQPPPGNGSRE